MKESQDFLWVTGNISQNKNKMKDIKFSRRSAGVVFPTFSHTPLGRKSLTFDETGTAISAEFYCAQNRKPGHDAMARGNAPTLLTSCVLRFLNEEN
ncbi:hypothetical protein AVEN_87318-1 [Araneus ventricosus]|uniref:Uncharacterized protein n=1 Tax=Araneus ventricosus TaxID=182803 RepID=A0A4Y2PED7_ARAVE|nr:hypothetical protein AVEN_87318-1 [Araneus ventricosus]